MTEDTAWGGEENDRLLLYASNFGEVRIFVSNALNRRSLQDSRKEAELMQTGALNFATLTTEVISQARTDRTIDVTSIFHFGRHELVFINTSSKI